MRLLNERVIDNGLVFSIGVRMLGVDQHLHKGEFLFPAKASVETVIDTLVEGKTIDRFVTIPEGKTSEEVVAILRADRGSLRRHQGNSARRDLASRHL